MSPAPRSHVEIEELLGAYALDAVEPDEREAIEEHLRSCPRCRAVVDAGREVAAGLAQTGAPAPPELWERIAATLEGDAPRREPRQAVGRRIFVALAAVAAAIVVAVLAGQVIGDDGNDQSSDLAAAAASAFDDADARQVDLRDDAGGVLATAAVLPDGNGFLRVEDLPSIDDGVYQLWGAAPDHVVSLGVFDDGDEVITFHVDPAMDRLMVTHEDAPVERTERPPVVLGELA